jgi:hypothetical protein
MQTHQVERVALGSAYKVSLMMLICVYMLVTPKMAWATESAEVLVRPSVVLGTIHRDVLGINSDTRYNSVAAMVALGKTFSQLGITATRWPGGTHADVFDWQSPTPRYCDSWPHQPSQSDGSFDAYVSTLVLPHHLDQELTVNYGTSSNCASPGDPARAAAWVSYANLTKHYNVRWWEIGNEVYEPGEPDNHPNAHTPEGYGKYEPAFYGAMKAVDPSIRIGIPITAGAHRVPTWDAYVLAHAQYDYVIFHYYPEFYPYISDARLLAAPSQGSMEVARILSNIRNRVAAAGKCDGACADYPISISEWNSVSHNPTPQTFTIVEGLFAAETLGEFFNGGVSRAEFWVDWACQVNTPGRGGYRMGPTPPVYGWQDGSGTQGIAAPYGIPDPKLCPGAAFSAPPGTIFPSGRAFQLYAQSGFATEGAHAVAVESPLPNVRTYASIDELHRHYVVMMINLDQTAEAAVRLSIEGVTHGEHARSMQYSKAIYDESKNNGPWKEPSSYSLGAWHLPMVIKLPPWSMTTYTFDAP